MIAPQWVQNISSGPWAMCGDTGGDGGFIFFSPAGVVENDGACSSARCSNKKKANRKKPRAKAKRETPYAPSRWEETYDRALLGFAFPKLRGSCLRGADRSS
jgi:hypothetical protein